MCTTNHELAETFDNLYTTLQRVLLVKYDPVAISQEFAELAGEEKILLAYRLLEENNLLPTINKLQKSDDASIERRKFGNILFAKKDDDTALKHYTQSIALAVSETIIALGYGNRSAVLFQKKLYKECIQDINRALCLYNTENFRRKLTERKSNAEKALAENPPEVEPYYTPVPEISGGRNELIECASDAIEMRCDELMGRHVVATTYIQPGDVIAVEKPFTSVILFRYHLTHCHHCANMSYTLIPCTGCVYALFCNENCRATAWKTYHKYECKFIDTLDSLDLSKTNLIALRVSLCARNEYTRSLEWDSIPPNLQDLIKSQRYKEIHQLCTNEHKRSPGDKFRKSVIGAVFMHLLDSTRYFIDFKEYELKEAQKLTARILYKHLQTAPCNMHGISQLEGNPKNGYKSIDYGAAAYAFLSMLNHSCTPNVVRQNHGTTMVLRAIRYIESGQQLFDDYGFHHAVTTLNERRDQLKFQYLFTCECPACVNDYPLYVDYADKDIDINIDYSSLQQANRNLAIDIQPVLIEKLKEYESALPMSYAAILGIQEVLKQCYASLANKHTIH